VCAPQELPSPGGLKEQEAGLAQAVADLEAALQYKEAEAKAFRERWGATLYQ
jgi:hypothetical protein